MTARIELIDEIRDNSGPSDVCACAPGALEEITRVGEQSLQRSARRRATATPGIAAACNVRGPARVYISRSEIARSVGRAFVVAFVAIS
jgi:hypothetical protein